MSDTDTLKHQAQVIGVEAQVYLNASIKERAAMRARYIRRVKSDAEKNGLDPDEQAVAALSELNPSEGQRLIKTSPGELEDIRKKAEEKEETRKAQYFSDDEEEDDEEEEELPYVKQGELKVYHHGTSVPAGEVDPHKRDGITIGEIEELAKPPVSDLVGDRPPRTLTDLFARWPIAEDPNYFIRVERTKPKRHAGLDVAGYIGDIRGRAVNESDLHRWLGGTEYLLTVYGPDPRGKRDLNDLPIVKPLTEPIKLVVPVLPPNLAAIPAMQDPNANNNAAAPAASPIASGFSLNPFAPMAPPTTNQHDASIHKTNMEFASTMLKLKSAEEEKKEREEKVMNVNMVQLLAETQKVQAETLREAANAREKILDKQLEHERDARRSAEEKIEKLKQAVEERVGKSGMGLDEITKLLTTVGPNREAESQRQAEYYRMQLDTLKTSNEEAMRSLRNQHDAELRRADERLKDAETMYKRMLDDERSKSSDREKNLLAEIDKIRREERDAAQLRIQEIKERFASEMQQAEKSHEREIRSLKESWETKLTVSEKTHEMSFSSLKERLEAAQEEAERAREEAKEAGDPVRVLERARAQAEAMGYEKKDDAPKTAFERLAATAGAGLSQALATINDWGPKMMAARGAAALPPGPQAPQLPPRRGAPPQLQGAPRVVQQQQRNPAAAQQQQQRRRRAASWATETVGPLNRPVVPETPLGFQPDDPVTPPAPPQPVVQEPSPQLVEAAQQQPEAASSMFPQKFRQYFSEEALIGFLMQSEQSINGGIEPEVFSTQFKLQFPNEAKTMVSNFTAEEVIEAVRAIPGSDASPLVRRDGEKWMNRMWADLRKSMSA